MVYEGKYENMMDRSISLVEFPNELLLNILSFLEIVDLTKCSQISKRIRVICYDESLWQRINLSKKNVPAEFLQNVIEYGWKCLNLNEANIIGPLRLKNESQLNHLDISGCTADYDWSFFEELFKSCHSLQTLSITQDVNIPQLCAQNGKTLQILNFWCEMRIGLSSVECILKNCPELKELHFWNGVNILNMDGNPCYTCLIDNDAVEYLVINISTEIEKFSLGFEEEEKILTLVGRCTKLKELRLLAYKNIRFESVTQIVEHLKPTLEKLVIDDAGWGGDNHQKLFQLKSMPKLKNLDFTCNFPEFFELPNVIVDELRNQLPDVSVNGYPPFASENGKS